MVEHLWWTNRRLLDAAQRLPDSAWTADQHLTQRGLRATLVHELDVEWSWRLALEGRPESAALRTWLESLSDEDLAAEAHPGLSSRPLPLWMFVEHLISHGAQQAADAATILSAAGASPGDIGFLEYMGETHGRRV
jgi:uncharacterized damage-inducible protein DinB